MRRCSVLLVVLVLTACHGAPAREAPRPAREAPAVEPALGFVEITTAGAPASARLPTILAIHGLGDTPESFAEIFRGFPVPARVIAPRAPTPWGEGFAWMTTRVRDGQEAELAREVDASAARLVALMERVAARRDVQGPLLVTGFSQGGILTYAVTLARPDLVRAAFPLAGLLPESRLPSLPRARPDAPSILAFHGEADVVVPYARDVALVNALHGRGHVVTLRSYPGVRHVLPEPLLEDLFEGMRAALTPSR